MLLRTIFIIFAALLVLGALAGVIVLQVHLSKMKGQWPGRILPIMSFIGSLTTTVSAVVGVVAFHTMTGSSITQYGELIDSVTLYSPLALSSALPIAFVGFGAFLLTNVPTLILTGIYIACRRNSQV